MRNKILGFAVLAVVSVMVATGAEAQEPPVTTQKTGGEAVGAAIVHPAAWNVEREAYTYDDTYGYTLWYPDTDAAHDHGGRPALRVALAYELDPEDIEAEVEGVLDDYPGLSLQRGTVDVAREHEGVAVGAIPGSTPYTAVYVPVGGRVYKINVYADDPERRGLDDLSRALLSDVRFEPPSRSVGSLDLPDANAQEALVTSGDPGLIEDEEATRQTATEEDETARTSVPSARGGEKEISEGCYLADPRFWVQTQHGKYANEDRWKGRRPGWTRIGLYNYWGVAARAPEPQRVVEAAPPGLSAPARRDREAARSRLFPRAQERLHRGGLEADLGPVQVFRPPARLALKTAHLLVALEDADGRERHALGDEDRAVLGQQPPDHGVVRRAARFEPPAAPPEGARDRGEKGRTSARIRGCRILGQLANDRLPPPRLASRVVFGRAAPVPRGWRETGAA